jgi:sodium-independent sulfate anion transporter 11
LPAVFFYLPSALLEGVIIHSVGDLITLSSTVYHFWRISPIDILIFFSRVFVTVFLSIENGICTTICVSIAVLLFPLVKISGRFLGTVKIHTAVGDHLTPRDGDSKDSTFGGGNVKIPNVA